jgi:cation diffusion facilitator CzcD-associated flavoprotein CzcO
VGRVAVVGAGPAGLTALRALTAAGLDAVGFERGARVGGIWTLEDRPTAAYPALHLITSRARTELAEFPMPPGTPDYPSREQVGEYLEAYAERFGLLERVRLGTEVVSARRAEPGGWELELGTGERERFDALVVASGHNDVPKWPDPLYPGTFDGRQLHALEYPGGEPFRGQRVVVVGMGNSAMDIASELSHVAARTVLSVRRGSWIVPKRLLGMPADQVVRPWSAVHVPWRVRQPVAQALLRFTVGSPEKLGLPAPARGLFQDHPTITDTVPSRIAHGAIEPKGAIAELGGDRVRFADGSEEEADAIVWCTGYRVEIPFLDAEVVGPDPQELALYKRVLHLEHDDLLFVGLMQSTGSALPIVERQSQLVAERLAGRWAPPPRPAMRAESEARRRRSTRRWGPHGRPAMRVDFDLYMHELARELEAGRARA